MTQPEAILALLEECHLADSKPVEVVESMDNIAKNSDMVIDSVEAQVNPLNEEQRDRIEESAQPKVIGHSLAASTELEGGETVPECGDLYVETLCYEAFMFMRDNFDQYSIKLRDVFKYLSLKYRGFSSSDFTAWKEDVENMMNNFVCIHVKESVIPETGEDDHTYTLDSNRIYRISEAGTLQFRELRSNEVADQTPEEAERQQTWDGRDLREAFEAAIDPPLVASNQGRTGNRRSSISNANDEMGALGGSLLLVASTTFTAPRRFSNSRESIEKPTVAKYLKKELVKRRNPQYKSVASRMLKYDGVEVSLLTVPNFDNMKDCEGIQCAKMERDEKCGGREEPPAPPYSGEDY